MLTNIKLSSIPFFIIVIFSAILYLIAYFYPVSLLSLKHFDFSIQYYHHHHPLLTPLLFMLVYILYASFSLPGIFILSLLAGFLFPQPYSTLYVIIAATIGATLLFLAAKTAFGQMFYQKAGDSLKSLQKGFLEDAASYLLFLRLIPLFPFWLVNLAGAFFGVPLRTFLWTTFLGMIPSVVMYTQAGRGFKQALQSPEPLSPTSFLNVQLMTALIGLALLALLPIAYRKLKVFFS